MPRVSDAYRQARRDEIVAATLRVLRRRALNDLTMADIIEEAGLSAGSVYSHFARKDELIELVATEVIGARLDLLTASDDGPVRSPSEVVRWWLAGLEADEVPFATLVQLWGEAASDPAIGAIVRRRMTDIEAAFASAAGRWLDAQGRDPGAAASTALAMLTFCQGYIVRSAVLGRQDLDASLGGIELVPVAR
ncbi:TetR/AcrR family transcriptional regulator [Nocardioides lianchengensis]|uniref:DNA-binding transcriptional regulator, AcrR family n=1 Tax=Nocardioides lianchengensis TaxID=1045774 RepID=A0A1G7A047_9ACTN|nr:TetR/AcrR family transcriptional regulator [Nocardioides lianchengensis]NYG12301.1 AcrR family transcriptional regulator [Nocardioides lianchengensis]SDE08160.1 DNA-binding transcriptional regulator, AcrR family [Nocardioides lianchengensis]